MSMNGIEMPIKSAFDDGFFSSIGKHLENYLFFDSGVSKSLAIGFEDIFVWD